MHPSVGSLPKGEHELHTTVYEADSIRLLSLRQPKLHRPDDVSKGGVQNNGMARYSPPYANVPTESEAVHRDVSAINLEVWLRRSNFLVDADEVAALWWSMGRRG